MQLPPNTLITVPSDPSNPCCHRHPSAKHSFAVLGSPTLQQCRTHAELEQTSLTRHMQATQDMYLCKYSPEAGLELAPKVEQRGVSTPQPDRNHLNNILL